VDLLTGQRSTPRPPDLSYPAALVARGEVAQGLREYEALCADRPRDPEPVLRAAWTLREHGRWDEALAWFRRALRMDALDVGRTAAVVRQVWEIEVTRKHDLASPIADLEAALARFPGAEELAWARRELMELKREVGGA
jgi:tetratricopeptide (TPR) repeat protein